MTRSARRKKLAAIRKKFLPEPVITHSVLFGFTKSATLTADKVVVTTK